MKIDCLFLILISILLVSCEDEESLPQLAPPADAQIADIDFVSGIYYLDANAQPIGVWGVPNEPQDTVSVYPNPFGSDFAMFSTQTINKVWVIEANCDTSVSTENVDQILTETSFNSADLQNPNLNVVFENEGNFNQINVNAEDLTEGFYRVFYQFEDGSIGWNNVFKFTGSNLDNPTPYLDDFCD